MADINQIRTLAAAGWSARKIARELGYDHRTCRWQPVPSGALLLSLWLVEFDFKPSVKKKIHRNVG